MQDVVSELNPWSKSGLSSQEDPLRAGEFWAVKDISFELRRGECLGLIGHNGAGKTTLLRMLNGLIKPDRGQIQMRGRIGALIALGAGFNPILSGRENIYVNAAVLGLSKREIDSQIDEIIEFSEIGEFIDAPVQTYSSGMQVRLGFAVATALRPDILLLDEVLAVGDATFRAKCYSRIDKLRKSCAMIFVSHDMPSIYRICTHAILMDQGRNLESTSISSAVDRYLEHAAEDANSNPAVLLTDIERLEVTGLPCSLSDEEPCEIEILIEASKATDRISFYVLIRDAYQQWVASAGTSIDQLDMSINPGVNRFRIALESIPLKQGIYYLCLSVIDKSGALLGFWSNGIKFRIVNESVSGAGACQLRLKTVRL